MEIVFFINTLSSGGAEHQMCYLANFMVEKGYDVTITTFGDLSDHYDLSEKVDRVRIAPNKSKLIKAISIINYFRQVKCDIVVSFCQDNSLLAIPGLLFNRRPKLIVGERNYTIGSPTRLEKVLFKFLYKRARYIVPNSHSQYEHIIEYAPELANKLKVITNYTDISTYKPSEYTNAKKRRNICVFAKYSPQKNCLRFAEVLKKLKNTDIRFHVDWYGNKYLPGDKVNTYYQQFQGKVKELGIEDVISLKEKIQNVAEKMTEYDIFCLPSLYEGFSNSLAEAICCGMPVLAGNVSDNALMVFPNENGFLFDPKSEKSIEAAINKMLQLDDSSLQKMRSESRRIACQLFDKDKFVGDYIGLIKE